MPLYLEPDTPPLSRRVFRYEHVRCESYIEFAYWADYQENGERARWYGYASKTMPAGVEEVG